MKANAVEIVLLHLKKGPDGCPAPFSMEQGGNKSDEMIVAILTAGAQAADKTGFIAEMSLKFRHSVM